MRLAKAYTAQPATITSWPAGSRSYRHFSLLGERGQGAERAVELQAVLERGFRLVVPLRELRNRQLWQPGWQQLPPAAMQIIPAIDLLDGHCVRLHQGDHILLCPVHV